MTFSVLELQQLAELERLGFTLISSGSPMTVLYLSLGEATLYAHLSTFSRDAHRSHVTVHHGGRQIATMHFHEPTDIPNIVQHARAAAVRAILLGT